MIINSLRQDQKHGDAYISALIYQIHVTYVAPVESARVIHEHGSQIVEIEV